MTLRHELTLAFSGLLLGTLLAVAISMGVVCGYAALMGSIPRWLGSVVGLALAPIPVGAMFLAVNWGRHAL